MIITKFQNANILKKKSKRGFTLVEMIGVLAIIMIIAGMLVPKILDAIVSSRINVTIQAYNTLKAASVENFVKWGKFANTDGTQYVGNSFDAILLQEGRIDARAFDKVRLNKLINSTNIYLEVVSGPGNYNNTGYKLDGINNTTQNASYTVQLVIIGAPRQDAIELSRRLDGPNLANPVGGGNDSSGIVEFRFYNYGKTADMYIYIAHQ
ncbi:MAG TPA: type II secretion system protein [Verrucomicrobiota bacterium]|nr:type II secretion system protein [Verrucomicrobiota bacterium]